MKTCRDCFHYTPCWKATSVSVRQNVERNEIVQYCTDFCDKRRVLELSVGIGEKVYLFAAKKIEVASVIEAAACVEDKGVEAEFVAEAVDGFRYFNHDDIGDTVFLTREGAEAALAIRNEKRA